MISKDITEHMNARMLPQASLRVGLRLLVILELVKDLDGKYRIRR